MTIITKRAQAAGGDWRSGQKGLQLWAISFHSFRLLLFACSFVTKKLTNCSSISRISSNCNPPNLVVSSSVTGPCALCTYFKCAQLTTVPARFQLKSTKHDYSLATPPPTPKPTNQPTHPLAAPGHIWARRMPSIRRTFMTAQALGQGLAGACFNIRLVCVH